MIKKDSIKIEEELRKEASQETVWQLLSPSSAHKGMSAGLSTTLNREESMAQISDTQERLLTGLSTARSDMSIVSNPIWIQILFF